MNAKHLRRIIKPSQTYMHEDEVALIREIRRYRNGEAVSRVPALALLAAMMPPQDERVREPGKRARRWDA